MVEYRSSLRSIAAVGVLGVLVHRLYRANVTMASSKRGNSSSGADEPYGGADERKPKMIVFDLGEWRRIRLPEFSSPQRAGGGINLIIASLPRRVAFDVKWLRSRLNFSLAT